MKLLKKIIAIFKPQPRRKAIIYKNHLVVYKWN